MNTVFALCMRNLKEFVRNRTRLIFSIVFPFFFIYVFSAIFRNDYIPDPIPRMLSGIAIATVFDFALRISSTTIDDMASGFMKEVLVSPVSRLSVAAGQFLSSAVIGTMQGLLIIIIGFFIGFRITTPLTIIYMILAMIFVGFVFAGFGLFLATNTKSTQTFQVISVAITMPMTFLSGAYIPLEHLPSTLTYISYINPLTYAVALFRTISLERLATPQSQLIAEELAFEIGGFVVTPWISALFLLGFGALFLLLSTISFAKTDFSKVSRGAGEQIDW